jgi:hypothetical protein
MGFMHDQFRDCVGVRLIKLVNDFDQNALAIDVIFLLLALLVVRSLQQFIDWRGTLLVRFGARTIRSTSVANLLPGRLGNGLGSFTFNRASCNRVRISRGAV